MSQDGRSYAVGPPPSPDGKKLTVVRVDQGQSFNVTIVGHRMFAAMLHGGRGGKQPCFGEKCMLCVTGNKPLWYGFVHCLIEGPNGREVILELPASPCEALRMLWDRDGTIQRAQITVSRPAGKSNGRVAIGFATKPYAGPLPNAVDVPATLDRMFGRGCQLGVYGLSPILDPFAEAAG